MSQLATPPAALIAALTAAAARLAQATEADLLPILLQLVQVHTAARRVLLVQKQQGDWFGFNQTAGVEQWERLGSGELPATLLQRMDIQGGELEEGTLNGQTCCLPLASQSRQEVSRLSQQPNQLLLYLEAADGSAFSPTELEIIRFLGSQTELALARVARIEFAEPETFEARIAEAGITGAEPSGAGIAGAKIFRAKTSEAMDRRVERVLEATGSCFWERDLQTDILTQSPQGYARLGYGAGQSPTSHAAWSSLIHPADRERVLAANREFVADRSPTYDQEYRLRCQDGSYRWIRSQAVLERDPAGRPLRVVGHDIDITTVKQTKLALEESEARFRYMSDNAPILIWMSGLDGGCTYFNRPWLEFTGRTLDQEQGNGWTEGMHPDDWDQCLQIYRAAVAARQPFEMEYRLRRFDGTYRWLLDMGQPRFTGEGDFLGFIGSCIDIHDRKQTELALRASEMRYWEIVEHQTDLICRFLPDGTLTFVNDAYCRYFNKPRQELVGQMFMPLVPVEDWPIIQQAIAELSPDNRVVITEHRVVLADGQVRWQHWTDQAIYDAEGNLLELQGVGQDITERKQAEEELQQSEERFRNLVETSSDWIWEIDRSCRYTYCSPRCQELLGYSPDELLGKTPFELMPPEEASRVSELFNAILAQQQPFSCLENVNCHRNGHLITLEASGRPMFDANGQLYGYRGVDRDITDRKQTEISLQSLVVGTAGVTGGNFFRALVRHLVTALNVDHAAVALFADGYFETLAFWSQGELQPNLRYSAEDGAACHQVIQRGVFCCEHNATQIFSSRGSVIRQLQAESYLGVALIDSQGETVGNICILDSKPLPNPSRYMTLLQIFAARASAELERQTVMEALQDSEAKLRRITDTIPGVVYQYYLEPNGSQGFDFISQGALGIYEVAPEQIIQDGQILWEMLPPEDVPGFVESIQQSAQTMQPWISEHRLTTPSGQEKWLAAQARPIRQDSRIVWNGFLMDVTQRRQVEAALRQNELRLRQITDAIPGVVYQYRLTAAGVESFPYISQGVQDLYSCSAEQVQSDPSYIWRYAHPEDVPILRASIQVSWEALEPWEAEYRLQLPNGQIRWISGKALPQRLPDGSTLWNGVLVDVTLLKEAQAALEVSQTRYSMATRAAKVGVWDWNIQTNEFYLDPNVKEILGYSDDEIPNDLPTWAEFVYPADQELVMQLAQAHLNGELPEYTCEHRMFHKDGSIRWILVRGNVIRDQAGRPLRMMGTDTDITDRKQLEAEIRRTSSEMQAIFDAFPDLFFRMDRQTTILDYKAGTQEPLYIEPENLLGRRMSCLLPPEIGNRVPAAIERALRHNQIVSLEYSLSIGAKVQDYEARIVPIQTDQVVATVRNISDRKQAERALHQLNQELEQRVAQRTEELLRTQTALQQSEEFLRSIYEGVQNPIFVLDVMPDGNFRQAGWNPACEQVTGQTNAEVQGKQLHEMISDPAEYQETFEFFRRCVESGQTMIREECHNFQNQKFWSLTTLNPLKDSRGNVYRIIGTAFDITDRKRAESALQESEERFRQLAENIESVFWMVDSESNKVLYVSPAYEQIWQRPIGQLYDSHPNWLKTIHPEDLPRLENRLDRQKQGGYENEYRILRPDGTVRWIRDRAFPIRNSAGQIYRIAGIAEDISERKQAEVVLQQINSELEDRVELRTTELRQAKEAAEAANLAKSAFLANMSHELRTPLNAILGFSQLMTRDPFLNAEHQQQLSIINRNGEHLLALINDILEMSKIEAGRATLNPNDFDLYRLLDTLMDMFQIKAHTKGLSLQIRRAEQVPQFIRTDESKLRQVLVNLLSNAIKFTESGQVTLRLATSESGEPAGAPPSQPMMLQFEVEDTGLGISFSEITSLFEPFVQTEAGRQSQEGTGLGLPISHQFVQLMGGELTVESLPGRGSCFRFEIQCQPVETLTFQATQPHRRVLRLAPGQPHYRILVVEDNWANRQLLVTLLELLGFEVRSAHNGEEAIALWRDWSPNLIWMDIRMPVLDGYAATQQIRAEIAARSVAKSEAAEATAGQMDSLSRSESDTQSSTQSSSSFAVDTVIIALTASAFEEERISILAAGCDDFVRKPVSETVLLDKMAQYLGVQYVYDEVQIDQQESSTARLIACEQIGIMPDDWIDQMHRAAQTADEELILQLIDQIPSSHQQLAATLRDLVNNFCLEEIMAITQTAS